MTKEIIMMMGIPGSGKSTYIQNHLMSETTIVLSSDEIREELYGDVSNQNHNDEVFKLLYSRINMYLNNENVERIVFDATNINKKRRINFIKYIKSIATVPLDINCIYMAVPFATCVERNSKRDRVVPIEVLERMHLQLSIPTLDENFDTITFVR